MLLFQPFTIPSASMEPNLYEGDYIVVSKLAYGYSRYSLSMPLSVVNALPAGRILSRAPHRGDIVVFKLPNDPKIDYIKRLIGVPGDRIQVKNGLLFLNGGAGCRAGRRERGRRCARRPSRRCPPWAASPRPCPAARAT